MNLERLAEELRRECGCRELPVDVEEIARQMRVSVVRRRWRGLPQAVTVLTARLVILKVSRMPVQRRFDLAHELFHFAVVEVFHSAAANVFASALLMPRRDVESAVIQKQNLEEKFGVSTEAARRRVYFLKTGLTGWPGGGRRWRG